MYGGYSEYTHLEVTFDASSATIGVESMSGLIPCNITEIPNDVTAALDACEINPMTWTAVDHPPCNHAKEKKTRAAPPAATCHTY